MINKTSPPSSPPPRWARHSHLHTATCTLPAPPSWPRCPSPAWSASCTSGLIPLWQSGADTSGRNCPPAVTGQRGNRALRWHSYKKTAVSQGGWHVHRCVIIQSAPAGFFWPVLLYRIIQKNWFKSLIYHRIKHLQVPASVQFMTWVMNLLPHWHKTKWKKINNWIISLLFNWSQLRTKWIKEIKKKGALGQKQAWLFPPPEWKVDPCVNEYNLGKRLLVYRDGQRALQTRRHKIRAADRLTKAWQQYRRSNRKLAGHFLHLLDVSIFIWNQHIGGHVWSTWCFCPCILCVIVCKSTSNHSDSFGSHRIHETVLSVSSAQSRLQLNWDELNFHSI